MIRNVKDVSALFDRRFGAALARPLSILRTLAWMVLGMYLIGLLVPAPGVRQERSHVNRQLQTVPVRDLMLNKNDPRGWKRVKKDPKKFTIAWIGGSTIQTVKPESPGFLAVDVLHRLPDIDGKPVTVNMYLMEASRVFDLHATVAEALASKPDMVILDLNPLWLFNPNAIQYWDNLNSAALPHLARTPGNWPLMLSLYSPRDLALAVSSSHLSSIRDRWSYAQKLPKVIDRLAPKNDPVAPVGVQPRPGDAQIIAAMQAPLNFWNYYRLIPRGTPGVERYPMTLRQAKTDGSALNDSIVRQTLADIGDSKIPALVYVSAVDASTLDDPATDAALHRVERHLRQIAAERRARTLRVQWQSGTRLVQGLQFKDMVHMTYDAPMANLLAKTVCAHLTAVEAGTQCTATSRSTP
jgi:hypothetical protein